MANLEIKDIDDKLYSLLCEKARSENRSISQEVVTILEKYFANSWVPRTNPAQRFLALTGSFKDNRSAEEIIKDLQSARTKQSRL